jgi:hypothetical protein
MACAVLTLFAICVAPLVGAQAHADSTAPIALSGIYLDNDPAGQICNQALSRWEREKRTGDPKVYLTDETMACVYRYFREVTSSVTSTAAYSKERETVTGELRFVIDAMGNRALDRLADTYSDADWVTQSFIDGWLFAKGHPAGLEKHVRARRSALDSGTLKTREDLGLSVYISNLVGSGKCIDPECSERIGETLKVAEKNLDLFEAELRATEAWEQANGRPEDARITEEALDMVINCRSGRATVGRAKSTE